MPLKIVPRATLGTLAVGCRRLGLSVRRKNSERKLLKVYTNSSAVFTVLQLEKMLVLSRMKVVSTM